MNPHAQKSPSGSSASPGREMTALVLGVNGQDGSYLAETLLAKEYRVVGVGRQRESRWVDQEHDDFEYVECDLTDLDAFDLVLRSMAPDFAFHFAAVHGSSGFPYEDAWKAAHVVNTLSLHALLEYARTKGTGCRIVYASSAKVFGSTLAGVISEATPFESTCIYSITKNAAHDLVRYYREHHDVAASTVFFFNHESPRHRSDFFIPKLVQDLAESLVTSVSTSQSLDSLNFWGDWGDAREFMELVAESIEIPQPVPDMVMASGRTWLGADLVSELSARWGLDNATGTHPDPNESLTHEAFQVDISLLEKTLGQRPRRSILETCDDILQTNHPKAWQALSDL